MVVCKGGVRICSCFQCRIATSYIMSYVDEYFLAPAYFRFST
jgi:hypothetical protein